MSAIQYKRDPFGGNKVEGADCSTSEGAGKSNGAMLIELGIALAGFQRSPLPGQCSRCRGYRNIQNSSAQFPEVFCSDKCELEFIRTAVAELTLVDCVRMHKRLECLLDDVDERAGRS